MVWLSAVFLLVWVYSTDSAKVFKPDDPNCAKFNTKPTKIDRTNKYHLWPDLISSFDVEHGETLTGFNEAMEIIWRNQNPPDCSKAKYLIAEPFFQGVGSEMHVHGVALGMAIATNRVFLQYGGWQWRFRNPHCASQKKYSLECYYVPLSNCTLADAAATMQTINPEYIQPLPLHQRTQDQSQGNSSMTSNANPSRRLAIRPAAPGHAPHSAAHGAPGGNIHHRPHNAHGGHHANPQESVHWSAKEDADLEAAVIRYGVQGHWQQIAEALEASGKTDVDCLHRFRNTVRKRLNMQPNGPKPPGRPNFNDEDTMTDLSVEGYGVVLISKSTAIRDPTTNAIKIVVQHQDKVSDNVVMLSFRAMLDHRKYVANNFTHILNCLEVSKRGYPFWWWRAMSATYFLRPNVATLDLLDKHSDPVIRNADGMCVSAYVRHGDKGIEMSLVPFTSYATAAYCMWQDPKTARNSSAAAPCAGALISADGNTAVPPRDPRQVYVASPAERPKGPRKVLKPPASAGKDTMPSSFAHIHQPLLQGYDSNKHPKVFYLGSEDPGVFREARQWAATQKIDLRYSNVSQQLLSDQAGIMKHSDMENRMPANRQMEYFSYLLHLGDLLRCRAFVCTLASNYCRLVDELRATVGGKANAYYADLTLESCSNPPCVRPFSIAGYRGEIHDPTWDTLWRR